MTHANITDAKNYTAFEVSCKTIILDPAHTKILLVGYDDGLYSLPGGHLEPGETPVQAAARELAEELDLHDLEDLRPAQFFMHLPKNKLILTFLATLDDALPLPATPQNDEHLAQSEWISLDDFRTDTESKYCDATYREMIFAVLEGLKA